MKKIIGRKKLDHLAFWQNELRPNWKIILFAVIGWAPKDFWQKKFRPKYRWLLSFYCKERNWQKEFGPFDRHLLIFCCQEANFGRKNSELCHIIFKNVSFKSLNNVRFDEAEELVKNFLSNSKTFWELGSQVPGLFPRLVLIAPRINFIKMIKLPVSRMLGLRDRIVNVPITSKTICQTVESLPRTLEEAQVIPISLRKQKSMVSSHF